MLRAAESTSFAKAVVDLNESLPLIHDPQLNSFKHRSSNIEFIRLLSDEESAKHSYVFEIVIKSNRYALKLVSLSC